MERFELQFKALQPVFILFADYWLRECQEIAFQLLYFPNKLPKYYFYINHKRQAEKISASKRVWQDTQFQFFNPLECLIPYG